MRGFSRIFSIVFLSSLFFLIAFSSFSYGYGMASSYLANNTMYLKPGEAREYSIELQNNDPNELKFIFQLDSNISSIVDKAEYYLIGNTTVLKEIRIKVDMPKDAIPGEEFVVRYSAYPISSQNSQISLNIKLSHDFKVIAIPKDGKEEEKTKNNGIIAVLAIPLLIIILLIIAFVAAMIFKKSKSLLYRRRFR